MQTIKRFASTSKVIIAKVDGVVMAGGVGLAAASDRCVATRRSQVSLSEALWGLLPAMVIPYLIRRVGYQTAYKMTLTTNIKQYFRQMWLINDDTERLAVSEISRLVSLPEVKANIQNFISAKKFLWEK